MKCAACGYEYRDEGRWIDVVHRYKSGKRKGEIKSVDKEWLATTVGHAPFHSLKFEKEVDALVYKEDCVENYAYLYACPECGTVKVNL